MRRCGWLAAWTKHVGGCGPRTPRMALGGTPPAGWIAGCTCTQPLAGGFRIGTCKPGEHTLRMPQFWRGLGVTSASETHP